MDNGSFGGGFALSFFLGNLGLLIAVFGKEKTLRGAITAHLVKIGIIFVLMIIWTIFCLIFFLVGGLGLGFSTFFPHLALL